MDACHLLFLRNSCLLFMVNYNFLQMKPKAKAPGAKNVVAKAAESISSDDSSDDDDVVSLLFNIKFILYMVTCYLSFA